MNTNSHPVLNKKIFGLVLGFAATLGLAGQATAASSYKVIQKYQIALGDWENHYPSKLLQFYLPKDFDPNYKVVLQMNVSSTNKSQYNAIYLNPEFIPGEFEGCDHISSDRNENSRIELLPYVDHYRWNVYHKVIDGAYLKSGDNYLLVCSRNEQGEGWSELDNFYLSDIVLQYLEYKPAPEFCPALFEPVCGVDGITYNNACEADQASVEIQHEGSCSIE